MQNPLFHFFTLTEFCRAPYQVVMKIPSSVSITNAAGIRTCTYILIMVLWTLYVLDLTFNDGHDIVHVHVCSWSVSHCLSSSSHQRCYEGWRDCLDTCSMYHTVALVIHVYIHVLRYLHVSLFHHNVHVLGQDVRTCISDCSGREPVESVWLLSSWLKLSSRTQEW